jgi:hypothetical protein
MTLLDQPIRACCGRSPGSLAAWRGREAPAMELIDAEVFTKLGITSRTELNRVLPTDPTTARPL